MPETTESATHTCRVGSDGAITVDSKAEPMVRETTPDGTKVLPAANLFNSTAFLRNVFVATYAGDGRWNVDCQAGLMRWCGTQSGVAVSNAMKRCGFETSTIKHLMGVARKTTHRTMVRQF